MSFSLPDLSLVRFSGDPRSSAQARDLALGFASILMQLHRQLGGAASACDTLGQIAAVVSQAVSMGHSCVPWAALPEMGYSGGLQEGKEALASSPVVACLSKQALPPGPVLLVCDRDCIYLQRYWHYETRLAARLQAMDAGHPVAAAPVLAALLARLFPHADGAIDWQQIAVATALLRRLTIVSGGPGTGKTRTVARLVAAMRILQPGVRVALAAPTGKAALRLEQSVATQLATALTGLEPQLSDPVAASTVHRLLGARYGSTAFAHDASHPLPFDLIVVDEASMLDLALASKLVDAVPLQARLVLLGDANQLASVETGVVLAELCSLASRGPSMATALAEICQAEPQGLVGLGDRSSALANAVVHLRTSYRYDQDGSIGQLASAINQGQRVQAEQLLSSATESIALRSIPAQRAAWIAELMAGFGPLMELIRESAEVPAVLLQLARFRILCALREGPLGVLDLNAALGRLMRQGLGTQDAAPWFVGRLVLVTQNDALLGLSNGDVGVVLKDPQGALQVYFDHTSGVRSVPPGRLAHCESAFALTVHKAQGSEFDRIEVILPDATSPLCTREMLYTAVTRARERVRLWATPEALGVAIDRPTERYSLLADRLRHPCTEALARLGCLPS